MYIIDLLLNIKMLNIFHADRLQKDLDNPLPGQNRELEEPIIINSELEYKINKILTSRTYYRRL